MALRKSEIHSRLRSIVQLIRRYIVAHLVAAIVGKPQLLCLRMPIETYRVSNTSRESLEASAIGLHAVNGGVGIRDLTEVAGRANRHIQPSIGSEGDEFPSMMALRRQRAVHDSRLGNALEIRFDIVVTRDAVDFRDIQRAVAKCHSVGHIETTCDADYFVGAAIFILIDNRVDIPGILRSHEQGTVWPERHGSRISDAAGINSDAETGRKLD